MLRFNVKDISTTALQRNIFKAFARKKYHMSVNAQFIIIIHYHNS